MLRFRLAAGKNYYQERIISQPDTLSAGQPSAESLEPMGLRFATGGFMKSRRLGRGAIMVALGASLAVGVSAAGSTLVETGPLAFPRGL